MINPEHVVKVIAEALGNQYSPNKIVSNTEGWNVWSNSEKIAAKLNHVFGLSLAVTEIQDCYSVSDLIMLVMKNRIYQEKPFSSNRGDFGKECLNIVITGKSGAGKSSFLNYLIGEDHFVTGVGEPVTQSYFEDYIYKGPNTNVVYHLYDTKGIEPTTTTECSKLILDEIVKRDKQSMFDWIHTVYYCIAAPSKRIEEFEINFINELKKHVSIVILLTKKDLVSTTDLNNMVSQIELEVGTKVQIVPVCSIEQTTRKGTSIREGKENVLKASFLGLWEKLANTYPFMQLTSLQEKVHFPSRFKTLYNEWNKKLGISDAYYYDNIIKEELSISFLTHYPLLKDTGYANISSMQELLLLMMNATNDYVKSLFETIRKIDVEQIWTKNDNLHRQVFAFYQKVNKVKPKVLYSNLAKESMLAIRSYAKEDKYESLTTFTAKMINAYKELRSTLWSTAEERLDISNCYIQYRDIVMKIGIELNFLINNFISVYRAELLQYGQYCLKKEIKKEEKKIIDSEDELDTDEKVYFQVVMACLEDRQIGDSERFMLEQLFGVLNISPERAGLIEDFARNHM